MCDTAHIDIWQWDFAAPEAWRARWQSVLSEDERERIARFKFDRDKQRFLVCRAWMRRIIGWYVGCSPEALTFAYGIRQKPSLASGRLEFNLSHTDGLAVLAVSREFPVGVDVEKCRTLDRAFMESVLSPAEKRQLDGLADAACSYAFLRVWTAKEAQVKAMGDGLFQSLKAFEAWPAGATNSDIAAFHRGRLVDTVGAEMEARQLHSFVPAKGYVGAVVLQAPPDRPIRFNRRQLAAVRS